MLTKLKVKISCPEKRQTGGEGTCRTEYYCTRLLLKFTELSELVSTALIDCVFKHSHHALFPKNSSTENIVFVIVKNKLTACFHCLYSY